MRILVALLLSLLWTQGAPAAEKTTQIRLVIGFAPGGSSYLAARFIAQAIEDTSDISVIVESKDGAGGRIAANSVLSNNDPHEWLFMSSSSALRVPPDLGLVPMALVADYRYVVATSKDAPADLQSYMDAARKNDGLRNFGTPGAGSFPHLIGMRMFREHDLEGVHIAFSGSNPAITDLLGKHSTHNRMAIVPYPDFLKLKGGVNEVASSGNGITEMGWMGIYAPPSVTPPDIARYSKILKAAVAKSETDVRKAGFEPRWAPADVLRAMHQRSYDDWKPELDRLGIKF